MSKLVKLLMLFNVLVLISCGGKEEKKTTTKEKKVKVEQTTKTTTPEKITTNQTTNEVDLSNKGVGPVKSVDIAHDVDAAMAAKGKEMFNSKCTACHKVGKKFIGPDVTGVLKRRSPEWTMNMILNPEVMIQEDPIAKKLLMEYNGAPMANQSLSEDEARLILEYFRTL